MSRRPFIWKCSCCHGNKRDQPADSFCIECSDDCQTLKVLYTNIIMVYPGLRRYSMGEVFTRLWKWYDKRNPRPKKGQKVSYQHEAKESPCYMESDTCSGKAGELCQSPF